MLIAIFVVIVIISGTTTILTIEKQNPQHVKPFNYCPDPSKKENCVFWKTCYIEEACSKCWKTTPNIKR